MQAVSLLRTVDSLGRAFETVAELRCITDADEIDQVTATVAGTVMDFGRQVGATTIPALPHQEHRDDRPVAAAFVAIAAEGGCVTESALIQRGVDPAGSDAVEIHDGRVVLPLGHAEPYRGNWPYVLRVLAPRLSDLVRRGRRLTRRMYADRRDRSPRLAEQWERIVDILTSMSETVDRAARVRAVPSFSSIDHRILAETPFKTRIADDRQ